MSAGMNFWIWAGLLMGGVIALLSWPLMRRNRASTSDRRAINAAIYRDEMAELEKDRQSGDLSESDYVVARDELERRVLEDTSGLETGAPAAEGRGVSRTALALLVLIPLLAVPLYFQFGNPAALQPPPVEAAGGEQQFTRQNVEDMAVKLAARLEKNPDPQGWLMLARTYKALGQFDKAGQAYDKVGDIMNTEPAMILEKVELEAYKSNGKIEGKALEALMGVLKREPENPQGLMLAGTGAFGRGDFKGAKTYWTRLRKQTEPGSEDWNNVTEGINAAREKLGEPPESPVQAGAGEAAAAAPGVQGSVDIAPALKAKAKPDDVLFVFAKAESGPAMPLAVVRARVSDLPLTFNLDDSLAMQPDLKISGFAQVKIEARISKSGQPMAAPGDLMGTTGPVKPGAKGVKVVIDKVVP